VVRDVDAPAPCWTALGRVRHTPPGASGHRTLGRRPGYGAATRGPWSL
jgi:hypothetical protein